MDILYYLIIAFLVIVIFLGLFRKTGEVFSFDIESIGNFSCFGEEYVGFIIIFKYKETFSIEEILLRDDSGNEVYEVGNRIVSDYLLSDRYGKIRHFSFKKDRRIKKNRNFVSYIIFPRKIHGNCKVVLKTDIGDFTKDTTIN